jgi:hypothetical protein
MKIMAEVQYYKKDIAKLQLQTAVSLFLLGKDCSSVITLAGASNTILEKLVRNAGKEPFVDYARRVYREKVGYTPKRQSYNHHIDKKLGVIVHKHMGKQEPDTVELDLEKMAFDALARSLSNYVAINGQEEPFVRAFFNWAWENKDGRALMDEYMKVPKRLKPR